ncbi:MAG: glycosyltransferase [Solobacterium sp.]|nr:glycosyltransferase [Solobacterium sp.]
MKYLLINTFYNFESTGKLMHNFRKYLLEQGHEVKMLYGHGRKQSDPNLVRLSDDLEGKVHNLLGRISGMNGCFSALATNRAVSEITSFAPDVVVLGNLHGHYINLYDLYDHLRKMKLPVIQIMWDEYSFTGACAFTYDCEKYKDVCFACPHQKDYPISWFFDTSRTLQKKKAEAYRDQNLCFVGVPYTAGKARQSSLLRGFDVFALDEAVDQKTIFYPRKADQLRQELGIREDQKVILNVCPYPSIRKGGKYYIELAEKCLDHNDVVFVHVGFSADPLGVPSNFYPLRYEYDQNRLAMFYSMADLFVCTSLAETEPNTCIEALSCGTRIAGFDISGVPSCAPAPFGTYVKPFDTDALKEIVLHTPKKDEDSVQKTRAYARSRFDADEYNRKMMELAGKRAAGKAAQ